LKVKRFTYTTTIYLLVLLLPAQVTVFAQQPVTAATQTTVVDSKQTVSREVISPSDSVSNSLTLEDLIEQALENNPEIKAMQRRFDMMRARIPQAKALEQPTLSVGYMGNIAPFYVQRDDPSRSNYPRKGFRRAGLG
jgi:outer membrane protein TolC